MRDRRTEEGKEKRKEREGKKLAYSRSCSGQSDPHSEAAPLCSWMVCSSSDSEGRSLKVLSSRPGASREKRRARWGRGVAASGSAVLAWIQGWRGPSAPVESVTAGFSETQPLFWFASASPRPAQKKTRVIYGLGPAWHTTSQSSTMEAIDLAMPFLLQYSPVRLTHHILTRGNFTCCMGKTYQHDIDISFKTQAFTTLINIDKYCYSLEITFVFLGVKPVQNPNLISLKYNIIECLYTY